MKKSDINYTRKKTIRSLRLSTCKHCLLPTEKLPTKIMAKTPPRFSVSTLLLLLFVGLVYKNDLKAQTILNKDTTFYLSADVNDSITIHYIGCSGFFIRKGNNVVLIDPYFSYKKAYTYPFGGLINKSTIKPDIKCLIDSVFSHIIDDTIDHSGLIKTLLITHGHMDHYGDVPYLFQSRRFNLDTIKVIGSSNTQLYLHGDSVPDRNIVKPVESSASSSSTEGKWIFVNSNIRVLPILSEHSPHLKIFGIPIYLVPERNKKNRVRHKYWRQYAAGQTLCYLIDFLNDDGSISFRMYLRSSASDFPSGFPAQSILNQHPIDIAMICVALFNNVKNYPEDVVRYLKPKHIIACHWEQFLKSSMNELKKKPETAPITNVKKFLKRLDAVLSDLNLGITYTLPNVNTTIKYFYSNKRRQ